MIETELSCSKTLGKKKVVELKYICKQLNISVSGKKKAGIIQAIISNKTTIPEIVPSAFPHNAPNTSSLLKLRLSATYTKAALILTALNI